MKSLETEQLEAVREAEQIIHISCLQQKQRRESMRDAKLILGLSFACFITGVLGITAATHWDQIKDKVVGAGLGITYSV